MRSLLAPQSRSEFILMPRRKPAAAHLHGSKEVELAKQKDTRRTLRRADFYAEAPASALSDFTSSTLRLPGLFCSVITQETFVLYLAKRPLPPTSPARRTCMNSNSTTFSGLCPASRQTPPHSFCRTWSTWEGLGLRQLSAG